MTAAEASQQYSPNPSFMERKAGKYLRSARNKNSPRAGRDSLGSDDLAAVHRVRRAAVGWAVVSGIVSGIIIGGTEMYLRLVMLDDPDLSQWRDDLPVWAAFYIFVGVLTIVEIMFLYWNSLRAVARVGEITRVEFGGDSHSEVLVKGLARSALEMPNPQQKIYGIDPYAFLSGWRLLIQNILYKVKVGATSFIIRVLMRRFFTRAALRAYIPLLAIPLYAGWNAFITWRVLNEAWLRAIGPYAVDWIHSCLSKAKESKNERESELIQHGIGEMIRRSGDAHPNYVLLLARLFPELETSGELQVDWAGRREILHTLDEDGKSRLLSVLVMTSMVAGKPRKAQREFLRNVHSDCGREYRDESVDALRKELMRGRFPRFG
jgi:hypothetical protein